MKGLFSQLIGIVITLLVAYCCWKAHDLKMSPFKVSVFNFILAILFAFMMLAPTMGIERVIGGAFTCQFTLAGVVHLMINDRHEYKKDAKIWINSMMFLMGITSILMLVMDYPNTKSTLYSLLVGFVTGFLGVLLDPRRGKVRKEESL